MFRPLRLPDGSPAAIKVLDRTKERLAGTCFRGPACHKAGNFRHWEHVEDVFADPFVRDRFLEIVLERVEEAGLWRRRAFSDTLTCPRPVGWASTERRDAFGEEELEPFALNKRSTGLRVKAERADILAPLTADLTVVYDVIAEDRGWLVLVHSMYPGPDVGELDGDVSAREGCVFFDWGHPGA